MRPNHRSLVGPRAFAIFAMAALGLLAPSAADAGCAHPAAAATPSRFDRLAHAGALARPDPGRLPTPAIPRPCNGPSCSRRDAAPLAQTVPTSARDDDQGDRLELLAITAVDGRGAAPTDPDDDLRPSALGPSIFHPPRPSHAC